MGRAAAQTLGSRIQYLGLVDESGTESFQTLSAGDEAASPLSASLMLRSCMPLGFRWMSLVWSPRTSSWS